MKECQIPMTNDNTIKELLLNNSLKSLVSKVKKKSYRITQNVKMFRIFISTATRNVLPTYVCGHRHVHSSFQHTTKKSPTLIPYKLIIECPPYELTLHDSYDSGYCPSRILKLAIQGQADLSVTLEQCALHPATCSAENTIHLPPNRIILAMKGL